MDRRQFWALVEAARAAAGGDCTGLGEQVAAAELRRLATLLDRAGAGWAAKARLGEG